MFEKHSILSKNRAPGNDELTTEFYLVFWDILGSLLLDSLYYSQANPTNPNREELSNTKKQAAITTLLEKKDKDKRKICNWRPTSPINVDG